MTEVVIWGRRPPPLGGVTRCVQGLSEVLSRSDVSHVVVDWRQPSAVVHIINERRALHLHNVSNVPRLVFVMAAKILCGGKTFVYFHSGTLHEQLRSPVRRRIAHAAFRFVDGVWATNAALAETIRETSGRSARVVSPYSSVRDATARIPAPRSAVVFVGYAKELYGLSLVRALKARPEMQGWSWTVVAYGDDDSCARVREEAALAGCDIRVSLDEEAVRQTLSEHEVLLRPTSADGDAMVVREALDLGVRVVASDVVPRPPGVELCSPNPPHIAKVLLEGGRVSDGAGLGRPVAAEVMRELARGHP